MKDSRKVTLRQVAEQAGVSIASVSRVMRNLPVKEGTRAKAEAAIRALNYAPNLAARALKTNSTQTIACSTRVMLRGQLSPLLASIEKTARDAGYTLILLGAEETIEGQRKTLQFLASRGIDGLIFSAAIEHDAVLQEMLRKLNIPVVFLDRDPIDDIDAVIISHGHGIEAAVRHLHSLGHTRIALLTMPGSILPGRERINAYKRTLQACKLPFQAEWLSEKCLDDRSVFQQASFMLSSKNPPTALIAGGVSLLAGVLRAVYEKGLSVGRDISVVAGADSELAELCYPGITATRWDMAEHGRVATELLLERIQNLQIAGGRVVSIPTELIVRDSTQPPTVSSDTFRTDPF